MEVNEICKKIEKAFRLVPKGSKLVEVASTGLVDVIEEGRTVYDTDVYFEILKGNIEVVDRVIVQDEVGFEGQVVFLYVRAKDDVAVLVQKGISLDSELYVVLFNDMSVVFEKGVEE